MNDDGIINKDRLHDLTDDRRSQLIQWLHGYLYGDLIDLWPMDESPGASQFRSAVDGGNTVSLSGTWSLNNTPITSEGPFAPKGDGSTGYGAVGDVDKYDLDGSTDLTFGIWVQSATSSGANRIAGKYDGTDGWLFYRSANDEELVFWANGASSDVFYITDVGDVATGVPVFVAFTRRASDNRVELWVDGVKKASKTQDVGSMANSQSLDIGRRGDNDSGHWEGELSAGFGADRILTDTEIKKIAARGRIV